MEIIMKGKIVNVGKIREEWYQDVEDPDNLLRELKASKHKPDILTFLQRLPETKPKFEYYLERESIAALPITSFEEWWKNQISAKTRNIVKKAEKKGVEIRLIQFDDDFVKGLVEIFNETPVRQGKAFWHYGKDFDTIKREFSRNIQREEIIGAYYEGRLVGFIMLANAGGRYCMTTQIISKVEHRDKSPTNALMAKAVQRCAERGVPWLVYGMWIEGSLGDFKRHNGFQKVDLPRYYVPLTAKGQLAMMLGFHKGWKNLIPRRVRATLIDLRSKYYAWRADNSKEPKQSEQAHN
jgi:hypothetical protein